MKRILIILAPGFEEIEAVCPIDILRRGDMEVTIASLTDDLNVKGKHDITIQAELTLPEALKQDYDALVLPGGSIAILDSDLVLDTVKKYAKEEKLIAAICAAPLVLKKVNLLEGKHYTAHFSVTQELPNVQLNKPVIQDGNIITANGPGAAILFALSILGYLTSEEKQDTIGSDICLT